LPVVELRAVGEIEAFEELTLEQAYSRSRSVKTLGAGGIRWMVMRLELCEDPSRIEYVDRKP